MNVQGSKSGNLHNKLGKKRGERKKSMRKRKRVLQREESLCVCVKEAPTIC